jgi:hypothetical protein
MSVPYPFLPQMAKVERRETVWKVRMGGEVGPCQVKQTAPRGLLRALHATEDPLSRALQRLSRQSLEKLSEKGRKGMQRSPVGRQRGAFRPISPSI